jgi:hypothetical protein
MADKTKDGGPAFPCHADIIPSKDGDYAGMTLRDYFAAKAMQAMVSAEYMGSFRPPSWASEAYAMADAMLAARGEEK